VLGLLVGAALSWWLTCSLRRLTHYAQAVSEGERAALPHYKGGELQQLATAVERMRTQLEGKAYVERYVHTLTHELKSPLAAIRGASELLRAPCRMSSGRASPAISSARASACSR
jgi:two-component system sensor histidine kinase CreC